jgi:1,2-diacylglycerol 3-alpha-glucosyltransferase
LDVRRKFPDLPMMIISPVEYGPDLEANRSLAVQLHVNSKDNLGEGHNLVELPDCLASVAAVSRSGMPGHPIELLSYMAAARLIVYSADAAKRVQHLHDALMTCDRGWEHLAEGYNFAITGSHARGSTRQRCARDGDARL